MIELELSTPSDLVVEVDVVADGVPGRTILNGSGAPSGAIGADGDFYLDVASSRLYGPRTAGSWGTGVSLVGPTGPIGPGGVILDAAQAVPPGTPAGTRILRRP